MALRGKKPEPKNLRAKLMMFSLAGVGKTTAALQMPAPYIIDSEAGTSHYADLVEKSGGAVFQTTSIDEVIAEVKSLMTTKHHYKTLVIDSFTPLYESKMEEGALKKEVGDAYGKHIAYADRSAKTLFRLLTEIDMNVIVTSHAKDEYKDGQKVGIKFDGWKKLDYLFDVVLELERRNTKRFAIVRKTRLASFKDQDSFEWSAAVLAEKCGFDNLHREAQQVPLASAEQVAALTRKVAALNIPEEEVQKWLEKADAESFSDMTDEIIKKCLAYCDKKLAEAQGESAKIVAITTANTEDRNEVSA